jgi:hypothetical protein
MARSLRQFKETVEMRSGTLGKLRSSRHLSTAIMLSALVLVACVHIWQRVHVIHLAQNVGALREDNRLLVDATKKIRSEVAALSMTTRIETYAADTLGLKPITAERLVVIKRENQVEEKKDEFSTVLSSIQRVADYLPELSEAQAEPAEFRPIKFDSLKAKGQNR